MSTVCFQYNEAPARGIQTAAPERPQCVDQELWQQIIQAATSAMNRAELAHRCIALERSVVGQPQELVRSHRKCDENC